MTVNAAGIERIFRAEYGRALAVLIRVCGDIALAEEAVQDAFTAALERWPSSGLPPSPVGWIITTARNAAIDRFRREAIRADRHAQAAGSDIVTPDFDLGEDAVTDDRLRLIFTCCHPALARDAQVGLTLRLIGGLTTSEIARAFLISEATMAQRLVRAKNKIRAARIPYRVPEPDELPGRVRAVLAVVYLIYNGGYIAASGADLVRGDLCGEAIRLGRLIVQLLPDEMEAKGLLALMLLVESRSAARVGDERQLIRLGDQDRTRWDRLLIAEGQSLVRQCLARNRPGPYQLQAAINAVHGDAADPATTDWRQILALYDRLLAIGPTPVIALNRAVTIAEVESPVAALAIVESLPLENYYLFHAIRADLLVRVGRYADAGRAYDAAIARTENQAERTFLSRRRHDAIREE